MYSSQIATLFTFLNLCSALSRHPLLLVVSFDGFRYDFFSKCPTPGLNAFKSAGTRASYTRNVFPTKTFPNHHSIATGLFPESHGVLGNQVYDSISNRVLHFGPEMYNTPGVTPIWVSKCWVLFACVFYSVLGWDNLYFDYTCIVWKWLSSFQIASSSLSFSYLILLLEGQFQICLHSSLSSHAFLLFNSSQSNPLSCKFFFTCLIHLSCDLPHGRFPCTLRFNILCGIFLFFDVISRI